ncbi:MAG: zinc ribbon domain-containing protein [Actinomycetota bacterium]|nr:zinc ribbon domain-containing protein [Actinomycetota bacterium]
MPTYEFRCTQCGTLYEVFQRIGDEPMRTCERCGGEVKKVFHPAGIVFKGSGFYATDSRRAAKTAKSESSADGKKQESKTPEKTEKTKDTKGADSS